MAVLEKGVGFKHCVPDFFKQLSVSSFGAGFISAVFSFSAGLIYISSAQAAGMDPAAIRAWVTCVYFLSGIFAVLYPIYYRKPVNFSNSIPGAIIFTSLMQSFTLGELMAGGVISGILLVIIGATGLARKLMRHIPVPIVMGMIGGVFLKFGLNLATPLTTVPVAVILMVGAYFLCMKYLPKIPGVIASLIVGIAYLAITRVPLPVLEISAQMPVFIMPDFFSSRIFSVIIAYSLPLTLLVIGAENAQAYGVLLTEDYDPPINSMTFWSGIGGIISPFFYLHNSNIAGPMTAICSSPDAGKKEGRWTASVVQGLICIIGGPLYASFATFMQELPTYFMNIVVALAIFKVLTSAFAGAFESAEHRFSAAIAFLIGASGITLLQITAPFWALIGGLLVYFIFEHKRSTPPPSTIGSPE